MTTETTEDRAARGRQNGVAVATGGQGHGGAPGHGGGGSGWWKTLTDIRTFQALKYREFRYLWAGQMSNSVSIWMEQVARPILVLDVVPDPQQAAIHVGGVLAMRTLPQFGFGLVAGVLADWYDRRMQILISKFLGTIVNVAFVALIFSGGLELWHIYATTFLRGLFTAFDAPARQAVLPSLVPREHLVNAVALNSASMQTMRVGAPSLAGLALAIWGAGAAFLLVAVFGALAVVFTWLLRTPPMEPTTDEKSVKGAIASLWEGLVFAWQTPAIRGVLLLTFAYFSLGMAYVQVFAPLLAKQVLDIGDAGFGYMVSLTGVGALLGSLTIATLSPSSGRGKLLVIMISLLGIGLVVFGATTYIPGMAGNTFASLLPAMVIITLLGIAQSSYFALSNTLLLEYSPVEKRGRIMGVLALDRSMITLGGAIAGFLAAAIGPQMAQIVFGIGILAIAWSLTALLPSLRKIE